MFSGTGTGTAVGTVAGTFAGTAATSGTTGTAGTVVVLAEVAFSSDSAGGGAVFLKVDYSQCLIFQKNCVIKWILRGHFKPPPNARVRSNIQSIFHHSSGSFLIS